MALSCFIIEDEPMAVNILKDYIRQTPFLGTTGEVSFLEDALPLIAEDKPDILFLDLNTRGLNKSLIEEVLKNKKDRLIILTTAYPEEYVKKVLQIDLNGIGHLHKPFDYDTFIKEVERMMGPWVPEHNTGQRFENI